MYVDKRAPEELKASAQSLLTLLLIGVGMFLGAKGAGFMKGHYLAGMPALKVSTGEEKPKANLPRWDDPKAEESAFKYLDLAGTVKSLLPKKDEEKKEPPKDLAGLFDADKDGKITVAEIDEADGAEFEVDGMKYKKMDLVAVFKDIHKELEVKEETGLSRDQWLAVQVNKWKPVWLWPSLCVFVFVVVFALAFRDKPEEDTSGDEQHD